MEGTVIKRLRERSFSRSFRHPSPPIFKSLLMARTHASFSRVLGEKSAKSATLSLSLSLVLLCPSFPSSTQVKVPNGENGNGPDANKTKSSSRFPPRFRLSTPLINSSLFAFRRVLPAFISQVFGKGDQNSAGSLPTPHTCVAPPSINVACLSTAPAPLLLPSLSSHQNLNARHAATTLCLSRYLLLFSFQTQDFYYTRHKISRVLLYLSIIGF